VTERFQYEGFEIPLDLVMLTGGGPDTWHDISIGHMGEYRNYCPIEPYHDVLEVGCGVGRDAIQLAHVIKPPGSYTGIDIIRPSIEWCQANITARYPHFQFVCIDVESQIHNPGGTVQVTDVTLPLADASTDRIILQSVFTHMFEKDIVHYLHEFRRILRQDGKIFASFFLLDDESLKMAIDTGQSLTFQHPYGDGCAINDAQYPEGAVGYFQPALERILAHGRFELDQPIHRGFWSGRQGVEDGQDIAVLRPLPQSTRERLTRSLRSVWPPSKQND
jgi:ubiquinone/menaquinone biosynthesis C-methylase UbiE